MTEYVAITILGYSILAAAQTVKSGGRMSQTNAVKPYGVGIPLSPAEVIELKMIVQDEDAEAALDYLRRLRRKVVEIERRHCGDPDKLPGLG